MMCLSGLDSDPDQPPASSISFLNPKQRVLTPHAKIVRFLRLEPGQ